MNRYIKDREDEEGQPLKVAYEKVNDRWEVALTVSDKGFQSVSFVNSIATSKVIILLFYNYFLGRSSRRLCNRPSRLETY